VVRVVACSGSRYDLCSIVVLTSWSWPLFGRLCCVMYAVEMSSVNDGFSRHRWCNLLARRM